MKKELSLPEWAFLDANTHSGDQLNGRMVILHVRSASVLEVFLRTNVNLNDSVKRLDFKHKNHFGIIEHHTIAVHYSFDEDNIDEILKQAAVWYCNYLDWEDMNISEGEISGGKYAVIGDIEKVEKAFVGVNPVQAYVFEADKLGEIIDLL